MARQPSIDACLADITVLPVDAIVNAANTALAPGGGVCGAIHRAAGPELARACADVAPCPTGEARLTPGFRLPARFVIHAVGPTWRGGDAGEPDLLASAYRSALGLARAHSLANVAFPAISTGIYGYPLRAATAVAVATVRAELEVPGSVVRVIFACFSSEALDAYEDEGIRVVSDVPALDDR
jgi:O-acetyl-ADP-ribose deacetylase (regulator of RNase III)